MRKVLVTAAAFSPLEVSTILARPEIRGIAGSADSSIISDALASAIEAYQEFTNNVLCESTWDVKIDEFPDDNGDIEVPAPLQETDGSPAVSGVSISYLDTSGATQTLAASNYTVDGSDTLAGRIALNTGCSWPSTCDQVKAVTLRCILGYATSAAIPQRIKDGLVAYIQGVMSGVDMSGVYWEKWQNFRRVPV